LSERAISGSLTPLKKSTRIEADMTRTGRKTATLGFSLSQRAALVGAALMMAVFGAGIVYGVGFAGSEVLHNVAHDTRHANGFPCH
jgi:cobalt transporter subunit CbtB